jgi:type II secretory pathway pseudopilin PulG
MRPTRTMHGPAGKCRAFAKRGAFTLLEVCLAIFIAMLLIMAAVPSITGVLAGQRAKKLFTQFDDLTREASSHAITERRPYAIVWDDNGVTLRPLAPADKNEAHGIDHLDFGIRLAPELQLTAALIKKPPRIWTFWPTGTCEPATIICHVPGSPWTAAYDPLTEQPIYSVP